MSKEATSEQSSICKGAGYDEVFQSGHEPEEGLSWLSERETLAHSPKEEVESCDGEEAKEDEVDKGEDKGNEVGGEGEDDGDGDEVKLMREPSKVKVQEALGMGIPVHLSFLKCGLPMTLSQRRRPTSLRI